MEMYYLAFGFIALVSAGMRGPEKTIVDGECNPILPRSNMDADSSDMMSSWVCNLLVWRCQFNKWISAYHAKCGNNEKIALTCALQNVFDCESGNQTCQVDDFGCEICMCEGGKFKNQSLVFMYNKEQQIIYKDILNKFQHCQQKSSECDGKNHNSASCESRGNVDGGSEN